MQPVVMAGVEELPAVGAVVVEPWGAGVEARAASPPGLELPAEGCRSIRRIYFPLEKTYGTSGTSLGRQGRQPGCVMLARGAWRAPPGAAVFRSAHS